MRVSQFFTMSLICRFISLLLVFVTGCSLYFGDVETDSPDAMVSVPDARQVDAAPAVDAGTPDAENLEACDTACPGQEYTPWYDNAGNCQYVICRPSYGHCACPAPPPPLPTCAAMGCDGTQAVPLVCPDDGGPCFCAAPTGPDGMCVDPPLVEAFLYAETNGAMSVDFKVNCPLGAPDGPHQGAIEFFAGMQVAGIVTFEWSCSASEHTLTLSNLPCGEDAWARAVVLHPITSDPTYLLTVHAPTMACNP